MLSCDRISQALKHSDQTFKKKTLSKNVNLDEKKSPHNEKKSKNVNLGDKKSQTNVNRHENVNWKWQKVTN